MDDLIRREDALKVSTMDSEIYFAINNLPSANTDMSGYSDKLWHLAHERGQREAQQQWIPCSERLPEKDGKYLITGRQGAVNILKFEDGRWYGKWGVLAWRPLPEPYREEK